MCWKLHGNYSILVWAITDVICRTVCKKVRKSLFLATFNNRVDYLLAAATFKPIKHDLACFEEVVPSIYL